MKGRRAGFLAASLAWATVANIAGADDKAACIEAHERGQERRLANRWVEARRLFLACSQPSCPPLLVQDCTRWESELAPHIPRLLVAAKRADGADVGDATLFIDGVSFGSPLPAVAVPLDPGEHVVRVEHVGWRAVEQRVILRDGEQDRRVELRFAEQSAAARSGDGRPVETQPSRPGAPVAGYVAGGLAVVATATSVAFLVVGKVHEHDLATSPCGQTGTCTDAQVQPIRVDYIVAGIAAGVAAVAAGVAIWQLVAHHSRAPATSALHLGLDF